MADIQKLVPIVLQWEGGYVNDPKDKGGATNMGVTLATWQKVGYDKDGDKDIDAMDIKLLEKKDYAAVLKRYWDKWQADKIKNQSVANILVDWLWMSGLHGITIPQGLLSLKQDGVVGDKTIMAINAADQGDLFDLIFRARVNFYNSIVQKNPSQKRFYKGWMNRLNSYKFSN